MKTSYTKRALAFWLAVAMLATGAPAALAREPDIAGTGGSTSVSGTPTTPTTPGETTEPGAPTAQLTVQAPSVSLTVGTAIQQEARFTATDGTGTVTYAIESGKLPAGVTLDSATGEITGTPTTTGTGEVTVKATNSSSQSTGTVKWSYTVQQGSLTGATITLEEETYTYTGGAIHPEVTAVQVGGTTVPASDYTVTYGDSNTDVGSTAKVIVTGRNNYTGSAEKIFTIEKADLKSFTVGKISVKQGESEDAVKAALQQAITATGVQDEVVKGTVEITKATKTRDLPSAQTFSNGFFTHDGGEYKIEGTFTPTDSNYNAKDFETTCDVTGLDKQEAAFKTTDSQVYEKDKTVENPVTVTKGNTSAAISYDSSDKSVATIDNQGKITILKAGKTTISAAIPGNADYEAANISYELVVNPKSMTETAIAPIAEQVYTGKELTPDLTVTDGSISLVKGIDYDVAYTDNVFPGTATATVTFKGNYTGKATKTFTINRDTYQNTTISQFVVAGQNAVLTIPVDLANAEITNYSSITVDGTDASIVDGTPSRDKNVITAKIKSGATNGQTANVKITLTTKGYGDVTLTYTLTVSDSKKQLTSSQINFVSKTVTADGKTYFKLDNASLNGVTDTNGKWTYALQGISTYSTDDQGKMPQFKEPGRYTIVASYQGDHYVGSKTATLTIKPATTSIISLYDVSQISSSRDDNYRYFDVDMGTPRDNYVRVNVDADDDLDKQRVDGTSSEWIGLVLEPTQDGTKKTSGLYVSDDKKEWTSLRDDIRMGDFYIDDVDSTSFELWYDTDDRDCSKSLYLATDTNGSNLFEIDVDFDSYSGSSSSSSGSSSSDTSKKDGDRVSTTTIDKTPSVKSRSATVTFSSSAMSDALDENKREARHEDADVTYIELDARTSKTVDDTTITVPRKSLDNIADEDTGLILTTNHGTFTFDDRALAEIYDTCDKTNIDFYIEEEDDDQYIVLIKDGSDDVIDLGNGEVEIVFDYRLKSGEKSSDVNVYRIGDGDKEFDYARDMKADYSSSKKEATFTTDTLGTFLVTTDTLKTGSDSTTTTPPTTPSYSRFVDVPSSRWSATYINKLASLGIINGTGGGYFEPTLQVTREEFVKMLAGVAGANVTGYTSSRFPDVPMSRWSASYIAWAADRGITTGTDGGRFAPTMKITREEMATMIYRYVQISGKTLPAKNAPVTFADADQISSWAQTAVSVMQQAGIIDGNVTNGRYTFDPKVPASREECAKMLSILYDLL